jgi:AcrR family transcriptional regulator
MVANATKLDGARLDPRVRRTRGLLQTAMTELLAEKGFESITVHDITERATLNRATFYDHFADKFALLDSCMREAFTQTLAARLSDDAALSMENLLRLIVVVCDFLRQLYDRCPSPQIQFHHVIDRPMEAQLYETILAWLIAAQPGGRSGATTPELAATATSWAIYGAAQRWVWGDRRVSTEDWARQALPLITAMFTAHLTPQPAT